VETAASAVTGSLADVTYWNLTVTDSPFLFLQGPKGNSPTSLLDRIGPRLADPK
jgi:hypothetical protein